MVDLTLTPASVVSDPATRVLVQEWALEALTAGKVVYKRDTDGQIGLADSNAASAEVRKVLGVVLHSASPGHPAVVLREGDLTLGAVLTAGVTYYLSKNPGNICPVADLVTGDYATILGIAISTSVLRVKIQTAGVAI